MRPPDPDREKNRHFGEQQKGVEIRPIDPAMQVCNQSCPTRVSGVKCGFAAFGLDWGLAGTLPFDVRYGQSSKNLFRQARRP
jgi:hypothetical protein